MSSDELSQRKQEHLTICKTDEPAFKNKTSGFERYDFAHYAIVEVDIGAIDLSTGFFGTTIPFPFMISCMTGGSKEADNINLQLAGVARELGIPLGLGSVRYALHTREHDAKLAAIRDTAGAAPIAANIGAAQFIQLRNGFSPLRRILDITSSVCLAVHVNPLQELLQRNGEPDFRGLLDAVSAWHGDNGTPLLFKEVGSGISKKAARELLQNGVRGIDVAGAGGTSWAGVELLRGGKKEDEGFWDWGIPTADCIRGVAKLKKEFRFTLIGSGGVHNAFDAAKALALGADIVASARVLLQELSRHDTAHVCAFIRNWFSTVKKIMYLTGCSSLNEFDRHVLLKKKASE